MPTKTEYEVQQPTKNSPEDNTGGWRTNTSASRYNNRTTDFSPRLLV